MVTGVSGPTANIIEPTSTVPMHPAKETSAKSDRRSNKPIMEKRRRARINNCLNELKTLILDATKKDPARHSKLEKADILEKTVKHLQDLQRQQCTMQQATDPKIINKFKAGFSDCINEVSRFPNLDPTVKRRLLQHLHNCINGVRHELNNSQRHVAAAPLSAAVTTAAPATATKLTSQRLLQMSFQSLPSPPSSPEQDQPHMQLPQQQQQQQYLMNTQIQHTPHGFFLSNGLQVIPTKLPNGNIALVLPGNVPASQQQRHPIALSKSILQPANYLNIPSRTSSAGSASSYSFSNMEQTYSNPFMGMQHTSCTPPSPANSHETQSPIHNVQQPLALVTRKLQPQQPQQLKQYIKEEDQPWRPW